ncbi:hypothetical protein F5Y10DRAFT_292064 [Nemania abortiva]|nr:hypothetical protein F5Y10DRAFT_292064 [Nemania abortiva]
MSVNQPPELETHNHPYHGHVFIVNPDTILDIWDALSGDIPREIRWFEYNQTFADPPNAENDQAWNDLLPLGRGYIFVPDGDAYGLEPGVDTEYGEIYSVTMFHQIHCLGLIRRNYWRLVDGVLDNGASIDDETRRQLVNPHIGHCFDYFRQSFECSADMTLEWPRTDHDGSRMTVDGVGIPHVCTSKRAIDEYMEVHQFNASHNHDIAA